MRALLNPDVPSNFADAVALGNEIVNAVERRKDFIDTYDLDAKFSLPDANWSFDPDGLVADFFEGYYELSNLTWSNVQYLRQRSQSFTGYSLIHMREGGGTHCMDQIPDYSKFLSDEPDIFLVNKWKAFTSKVPSKLVLKPKHMLGEVGWFVDGVLLNEDVIGYQERLCLLWHSGLLHEPPKRILEIGGGYGALAYALKSALPQNCEYWICDLPESLLFSGLYLSMTTQSPVKLHQIKITDPAKINLLPNYWFYLLKDQHFDVVINTLSMSEMSPYQVGEYIKGIKSLIRGGGKFFEQNQDNSKGLGLLNCKHRFSESFHNQMHIVPGDVPITQGLCDVWFD